MELDVNIQRADQGPHSTLQARHRAERWSETMTASFPSCPLRKQVFSALGWNGFSSREREGGWRGRRRKEGCKMKDGKSPSVTCLDRQLSMGQFWLLALKCVLLLAMLLRCLSEKARQTKIHSRCQVTAEQIYLQLNQWSSTVKDWSHWTAAKLNWTWINWFLATCWKWKQAIFLLAYSYLEEGPSHCFEGHK